MFLAIAVLLIHPQLATTLPLSADKAAMNAPPAIAVTASAMNFEDSEPTVTASFDAATQPEAGMNETLPDAPVPMPLTPPAPMAFLKSGKPMTVTCRSIARRESPQGTDVERPGHCFERRRNL